MTTQTMTTKSPTLNHKYYGRLMFLSSNNFTITDARFEWYYMDAAVVQLVFAQKNDSATAWKTKSTVLTQTSSSYLNNTWYIRNFVGYGSSVSYADDIMTVDLTNSFGTGNELT